MKSIRYNFLMLLLIMGAGNINRISAQKIVTLDSGEKIIIYTDLCPKPQNKIK